MLPVENLQRILTVMAEKELQDLPLMQLRFIVSNEYIVKRSVIIDVEEHILPHHRLYYPKFACLGWEKILHMQKDYRKQ